MSSRHGGRGRGRNRRPRDAGRSSAVSNQSDIDESSGVIKAFRSFQKELDSRNDRHERIVKLSRDITIESKKLIFLLQRVAGAEDKETILAEAASKMQDLHASKFLALANELEGQDPYQFLRAFSPGLQEYIEAVTFYHYLANQKLVDKNTIQSDLTFSVQSTETSQSAVKPGEGSQTEATQVDSTVETNVHRNTTSHSDSLKEGGDLPEPPTENKVLKAEEEHVSSTTEVSTTFQSSRSHENSHTVSVPIPPSEYMLGIADFTGELMRMAINSVGAGDLDTPTIVAGMMRLIHSAFSSFGNTPRELRHKARVLRQSLQKVETACYTLRVRGSEIPKHMLADVFTAAGSAPNDTFSIEENEEFYD